MSRQLHPEAGATVRVRGQAPVYRVLSTWEDQALLTRDGWPPDKTQRVRLNRLRPAEQPQRQAVAEP